MCKLTFCVGLAALLAAGAWGADYVVERAPEAAAPPGPFGSDVSLELKYDSGTQQYFTGWYTGAGSWVGNDFDITMISGFRAIKSIKLYSSPSWPNSKWDGFNVGVYAFAGGRPMSLLWGPTYFKPRRTSPGWTSCPVNWTLPAANKAFVAAVEQFYSYPDMDPFALDNNRTFVGHSWEYYEGNWSLMTGWGGYRNLMLRVVVDNTTVVVAPTSLGRVKALYY
jgi:hypothetical protein